MPFTIVRQDLIKMKVDAIVNAANPQLMMGGGVCGAIFTAAGAEPLQKACDSLAPIQTGEAVITSGFDLPARYIIHTAGPVYKDGNHGEEALLRASYRNSLKRAVENHCKDVAFPLISSGIYGYPKGEALRIAIESVEEFLKDHDLEVYLVVFDKSAYQISEELRGPVASYVDEHYVEARKEYGRQRTKWDEPDGGMLLNAPAMSTLDQAMVDIDLDQALDHLDEPFSQTLFRWIDRKGMKDVEVYKGANLDRKLFSKIRTGKGYTPGKRTILALAVALELTLEETEDLLQKAGYALSHSNKFDVILEYFLIQQKYNIYDINQVLFSYDQPLLGG